jgi:hypothetical protein
VPIALVRVPDVFKIPLKVAFAVPLTAFNRMFDSWLISDREWRRRSR